MSSETYPRVIERHNAYTEPKEGDRIRLETSHQGVDTRIELVFKGFDAWGSVVNVEDSTVNVWSDMTFTLLERPKKPLPEPGSMVLVLGTTDPAVSGDLPVLGSVNEWRDVRYFDHDGERSFVSGGDVTDWKLLTIEGDKVVTHG